MKNKKGSIGATMTWMIAIVIIFFLMIGFGFLVVLNSADPSKSAGRVKFVYGEEGMHNPEITGELIAVSDKIINAEIGGFCDDAYRRLGSDFSRNDRFKKVIIDFANSKDKKTSLEKEKFFSACIYEFKTENYGGNLDFRFDSDFVNFLYSDPFRFSTAPPGADYIFVPVLNPKAENNNLGIIKLKIGLRQMKK